jgi:hypothetical protein
MGSAPVMAALCAASSIKVDEKRVTLERADESLIGTFSSAEMVAFELPPDPLPDLDDEVRVSRDPPPYSAKAGQQFRQTGLGQRSRTGHCG